MEIKAFFYLLIVLSVTRNNLKVKKVIISLKKNLNMVNYEQYLLWSPYVKIYEKDTRNPQVLITHRPLGINTSYVLQAVTKVTKPHIE